MSAAMTWFILIVAGLFEIVWAIGLKYSEGFTRLWPTVVTIIGMIISMTMLGFAMRTLPVGTAYAVWTGIGAAGTVILGIMLFGEPATFVRIVCIMMILGGILGLKFLSPG